jgi:hypothetical protein
MIDQTTIITLIIFFVIGIFSFKHNKQIADSIAHNYTTPFKWIFGEKSWVVHEQEFAAKWMSKILYVAGVLCFLIIALVVGAILW